MASAFARAVRESDVEHVRVRGRAKRRGARPFGRARVLWLLAVTDRAVEATCASLVRAGLITRGDTAVHLAGMLGVDVLDAARRWGASIAAVHPLVAVADPRNPPPLRGSAASFQGDRAALRTWRPFARAIGLHTATLTRVERVRYHAAAALMATGGVALAQGASTTWARAIAPRSDATLRAFAASLLRSVAHNVAAVGADRALASPLLRGETDTVARHLDALASTPSTRSLYAAAVSQVLDTLERTNALEPRLVRAVRASLGDIPRRR
jgi:predicted short-subunit dehydrogenase-like oxidoreductase (DUF2520 family)